MKCPSIGGVAANAVNIAGATFGRLTVIAEAPKLGHKRRVLCRCSCGATKLVQVCKLRIGEIKSCGCLKRELTVQRYEVPVGTTFGNLTVIGPSRRRTSKGEAYVIARCRCGKEREAMGKYLRAGLVCDCGRRCAGATTRKRALREAARRREVREANDYRGPSTTTAYRSWRSMIRRCYSAYDKAFPDYGGRGIAVCDRWRFGADGLPPFVCFLHDLGPRPSLNHTIDRLDPDGDYEPGNCRWATALEQATTTRRAKRRAAMRSATCDPGRFPAIG